jgi:outer membrane protein TolC
VPIAGRSTRRHRAAVGAALVLAITSWLAAPAAALTLEEAVRLSLERNERARAAGETARAAGARVSRARSFLLPDLTVTGDWTRRSHETTRTVDGETSILNTRDGLEGRVTLRQTLFDARAWPLLKQAERSRDAADFDANEVRRGLAYETAELFLAVLTVDQVARAAAERFDLAESNEREVRVRFDTQLVSSNDVSRAELESATARRELVLAEGEARVARLALGQLLDLDIADSLVVPEALLAAAAAPPGRLESLEAEAVDRRPDIRADRARLAALDAAAGEPLMRYLPQVDVSATGWTTNESGFSGRDRDWTLGMGLTWPLFDGGDREATRSERRALARAAELELRHRERGVATEVASARVQLESRQASLAQAEVAVRAARRNAGEAGELYRRGLIRALEAVDARVQLFEAEVERAGAEFALALAWLDLRAALGLEPLDDMVTQ